MRHINISKGSCSFIQLAAIIFLVSWVFVQPVGAITRTVTLTALPAVIDTGGKAGDNIKVSFQLTNSADVVLPIQMSARDTRIRDGQSPELVRSLSAKNWIEFAEPDFILKSNETKVVEATLFIPSDAPSGGHYADMVVKPLSLEGDDGLIAAQPELAVQMLISVTGDTKEDLNITREGPSTIITKPSSKEELVFIVQNRGNIHTIFQPRLSIRKGAKSLESIKAQPAIILPSENKQITYQLPDNLSAGIYHVQAVYGYGGSPTKEAASSEIRVIVLPFSPKVLLFIPLVAIAVYAFRMRRRLALAMRAITKGESKMS